MKHKNKYEYYKVIQENWGNGWDDSCQYETDSQYRFRTAKERQDFMDDRKAYRENCYAPVRVINRRGKVINQKQTI